MTCRSPAARPGNLAAWPRRLNVTPMARVRLVEVTRPVSVGDLVYTAAEKGVLPAPLLYGRVVRLQRPIGAAHWEIWMQPALAADEPQQVAVLRTELNPSRLAASGGEQ